MKFIKILDFLINPETICYVNKKPTKRNGCGQSEYFFGISIGLNNGERIFIYDSDCGREYNMSAIDYFNKEISELEKDNKIHHDR